MLIMNCFQFSVTAAASSNSVLSEISVSKVSPPQLSSNTSLAPRQHKRKAAQTSIARKGKLSKAKKSKGVKGKSRKAFFCNVPECLKGSEGMFLPVPYFSTHKLQDTLERIILTVT
jgi:hypothetical protein